MFNRIESGGALKDKKRIHLWENCETNQYHFMLNLDALENVATQLRRFRGENSRPKMSDHLLMFGRVHQHSDFKDICVQ
jgi:hypothetical protein